MLTLNLYHLSRELHRDRPIKHPSIIKAKETLENSKKK